jgi:hypothetical protein
MEPTRGRRAPMASFILAAALLFILPTTAKAIAPPYVSDDELALKPVVVVARWPKARIVSHTRSQGNVVTAFEVHTELLVERVIKGNIRVGRHKLLVGYGVGWQRDWTWLGSYTSTELFGDVNDVSESSIWFLSSGRSWDRKDRRAYLSLDTYRGVQPLELEPYFTVLRRAGMRSLESG